MTETTTLRTLLLPELESELATTRRMLQATPDGQGHFKPHEKSMSLARLAGHLAELPSFATMILTSPDLNLAHSNMKPFHMETKAQALAQFDDLADKLVSALKNTSDETFRQTWNLSAGPQALFSGSRYQAYRIFGVNHIVHHRAQLGVYLRLLNLPVPGTYGPSADGM